MALGIVLEEAVAAELSGHRLAGRVINALRSAPNFLNVREANEFLHELSQTHYPNDWAMQGVAVDRTLRHGEINVVTNELSYTVASITNLPIKILVSEGGTATINQTISKLPIYVAREDLETKSKVAAYLVADQS